MAFLTADNTPLPDTNEDLYPSGSVTIPSGNAATAFSIQLGSLAPSGVSYLFDAKFALIEIANIGTSQTITAASLVFTDLVGTQTGTVSYSIPGVSIASGSTGSFPILLSAGVLKNASVSVTFGSAPTAGSVSVQADFQNNAAPANTDVTLINASAVTTTQTSSDQTNLGARGIIVVLNMGTVGTGSVTATIQGKDAASGQVYTLLAGSAVVTNSVNVYTVYPGAPATANVSANSPLPHIWNVKVTANNANVTTYTVGASYIL